MVVACRIAANRRSTVLLLVAVLVAVLVGITPAHAPGLVAGGAHARARAVVPPDFDHAVVLVLENKEYDAVIGNSDAPYLNGLADGAGLATRFYGIRHPSLPNYLALLGGSTFGITSDCTNCVARGRSLVDQLDAHGITWKGYMGGMPSACYTGATYGRYAKKHNPFMYFPSITSDAARCAQVQPLTKLNADLKAGSLPRFAFVSPDLCADMHDCSVASGDLYLSHLIPRILTALGTDGVLFVTFDEGSTSAGCCTVAKGGHIATIVAGPAVTTPVRSSVPYDLYSILRTIEEAWNLPLLRNAGCECTSSMTAFF